MSRKLIYTYRPNGRSFLALRHDLSYLLSTDLEINLIRVSGKNKLYGVVGFRRREAF